MHYADNIRLAPSKVSTKLVFAKFREVCSSMDSWSSWTSSQISSWTSNYVLCFIEIVRKNWFESRYPRYTGKFWHKWIIEWWLYPYVEKETFHREADVLTVWIWLWCEKVKVSKERKWKLRRWIISFLTLFNTASWAKISK